MNKAVVLFIVSIVCLACATTRKAHTSSHHADTTSIISIKDAVDSVTKDAIRHKILTSTDNAIVIYESIVYDTDKVDSLGNAPVKERKRAKIDYTGTQEEEDIIITSFDSTSHRRDSTQTIQSSETHTEVEERKTSHPPWIYITVLMVILFGLIIIVRFLR